MAAVARYYSSTAVKTTLASSIGSSDTTMTTASMSGFPSSYPYTLILEKDSANEEIVTVTAVVGTSLTITRGVDGTSGRSHSAGISVEHGVIALDFTNFRSHEAAGSNVHDIGSGASVVGTATTQTLSNKTLGSALAAGGFKITGLADPTNAQDAATKNWAETGMTSQLNQATTQATNAATSATAAAGSASAASTSASAASASQSAAATSASNASTSATNAASSASAAAASYDAFDDRYLVDKASDPTLDNDGNALLTGALYFNTTSSTMKVYTGSAWTTLSSGGTVTSVGTGTGLSGGPITTSGTINFSNAAVGTWAATPTSANLAAAVTDETGSGALVFGTAPTLSAPVIDGANPYIQFNNGSAVTLAAGRMWYDGSNGSWNLGMGNGNITQQVGEELFVYGKASSAITDSPLQIVYQTGTVGGSGVITFAPTVAGITDGNLIVGVATEPIALNGFGRVTSFGVVRNITTDGSAYGETWADGDTIWYNPVTGNPTKTKPSAPNIKVQLGTIIKAGSGGSGSFQVEVNHGSVLGGTDSNVQITSPTNNQLLVYDSTLGYWKNSTVTSGATISNDTTTATSVYPLFANATSGAPSTIYTSNANLLYKPSLGEFTAKAMRSSNGIHVNSQTVSSDYTVASGDNAMSAGPVTVASGVTVTISSGSVWTVV